MIFGLKKLFGMKKTAPKSKAAQKKSAAAKSRLKKSIRHSSIKKSKPKSKPQGAKQVAVAKETLIGRVTHSFPKVKAAVIEITKGRIAAGDSLHIKGRKTDFRQQATSLQIDRQPITKASKGQEIGLRVKSRVRENDAVYRISG